MTRVALVEPFPRVSGVTAYTWHAAAGFRAAGCDVDVVTFTRSGRGKAHSNVDEAPRGGWQWWSIPVDRIGKWSEATKILDEYDLVVLNEAKCLPLDKDALRRMEGGNLKAARERVREGEMDFSELPLYAQAVADLKRAKWAAVLHAPQYEFAKAPMLKRFLENVPTGLLIHHKPGALESARWAGADDHAEIYHPWLPYVPSGAHERSEWARVVGTTGRFITNKGQPTLIAAADRLPSGWHAEVWGAGPAGAGANHTFLAYEGLVTQLGWTGHREGQNDVEDAIGNRGDVLGAWRWYATKEDERGTHSVAYLGGYTDADKIYERLGVYVNLTDPGFCGRGNEYTHLEAMDAGCVCAVPASCQPEEGGYDAVLIDPYDRPLTLGAVRGANFSLHLPEQKATLDTVARALEEACLIAEDEVVARSMADENYARIRELNDPRTYAEAVLGAAF